MTTSLAARIAALLKLARRASPARDVTTRPALVTLATLNQARKPLSHPALPAYRLQHPVTRALGSTVSRPAWPFHADTPRTAAPTTVAPPGAREHHR